MVFITHNDKIPGVVCSWLDSKKGERDAKTVSKGVWALLTGFMAQACASTFVLPNIPTCSEPGSTNNDRFMAVVNGWLMSAVDRSPKSPGGAFHFPVQQPTGCRMPRALAWSTDVLMPTYSLQNREFQHQPVS